MYKVYLMKPTLSLRVIVLRTFATTTTTTATTHEKHLTERVYHKHAHMLPENYHLHKVKKYTLEQGKQLAPGAASAILEKYNEKPPVAVVFGWMGAKSRHLNKMVEYYNFKGMDAISYTPTPRDVLQPQFGRDQIRKLLEFLQRSEVNSVFHCFSTGGYMYGQALSLMQSEEAKHLHSLTKTIQGSIFDSVVDESGVREGIPKALFPSNPVQRAITRTAVGFVLSNFPKVSDALKHASQVFHNNKLTSPSLWLYSQDDDIADHKTITHVVEKWRARGLHCTTKFWEVSKHVSHAKVHPMEYFTALDNFLLESLKLPLATQEAIFNQIVATITADKSKKIHTNHHAHHHSHSPNNSSGSTISTSNHSSSQNMAKPSTATAIKDLNEIISIAQKLPPTTKASPTILNSTGASATTTSSRV